MNPLDLERFREAISQERVEWRKHVLQKMAERDLTRKVILDVLMTGEVIRIYEDDRPFPSALFLGYIEDQPLHVVAAHDGSGNYAYIITAYRPSLDTFEPDFKTRRKP